ncbi:hypothetical protein UFOVP1323_61 [uncultured Caudovirales phage]|uniref:Uncharacterized protein n=1 Tax=uncultured Caudovirales phage TaxID=2100421 RepID=A0A6J5RPU3_9CAUD|nr:hypothetical protein UFOVP1323_61 [uncultured Caudovirales phage]
MTFVIEWGSFAAGFGAAIISFFVVAGMTSW